MTECPQDLIEAVLAEVEKGDEIGLPEAMAAARIAYMRGYEDGTEERS
jgi:hypothetical protein